MVNPFKVNEGLPIARDARGRDPLYFPPLRFSLFPRSDLARQAQIAGRHFEDIRDAEQRRRKIGVDPQPRGDAVE